MAGSLKLSYSGTDVILSPLAGTMPNHGVDDGILKKYGITGTLYLVKKFTSNKINHRFEFNNISKTDADNLNTWKSAGYTLTYTPDTDTPGTTYQVKLINDTQPFDWMPNTAADAKFQGSLMIREI